MTNRQELADVYPDVPAIPRDDLIEKVCTLLEDPPVGVSLQPLRKTIDCVHSPDTPVAEDLIDPLVQLISIEGSDQPLSWHARRALAAEQGIAHGAGSANTSAMPLRIKAFVPLLELWAKEPYTRFAYTGLMLTTLDEHVVAELERFVDDPEAAACVARSLRGGRVKLDSKLRSRLQLAALRRCLSSAEEIEPGVWQLHDDCPVPWEARDWLREALLSEGGLALLSKLDRVVPALLLDADDTHSVRRIVDVAALASTERSGLDRAQADAVLTILAASPHLAPALAGTLEGRVRDATPSQVRALASSHPALLGAIVGNDDLRGHLKGAEEALAQVDGIQDRSILIAALIAIGDPATKALQTFVDEDIGHLAQKPADPMVKRRLEQAVEHAPQLGLRFWLKRLDEPHLIAVLWGTRRLRTALALDPRPFHRLLHRAAQDPSKRLLAWNYLSVVDQHAVSGGDLREASKTIITLVRDAPDGIDWSDKLWCLAAAGTREALDLASEVVRTACSLKNADPASVAVLAATSEDLWLELQSQGLVSAQSLLDKIRERGHSHTLCPSAWWAVVSMHLAQEQEGERSLLDIALAGELQPRRGADGLRAKELVRELHLRPTEWLDLWCVSPLGPPADLDFPGRTKIDLDALHAGDLAQLLPQLGERLAFANSRETDTEALISAIRTGLLHRAVEAIGTDGRAIVGELGDLWPTVAALRSAAERLHLVVQDKAIDRFADEALPTAFRASVTALPHEIDDEHEAVWNRSHHFVTQVFEELWQDDPALLARHLLPELETALGPWRRGIVLALVALREPCGTKVPGALTRLAHKCESDDERAWLLRQRDTFARKRAAQERSRPPNERTRQALLRLRRHARLAKS